MRRWNKKLRKVEEESAAVRRKKTRKGRREAHLTNNCLLIIERYMKKFELKKSTQDNKLFSTEKNIMQNNLRTI